MRSWILDLASRIGWRVDKVIDCYRMTQLIEVIDVKDDGDSVKGIRTKVPSERRRDQQHYVSVGIYGAKCTCESSTIGKRICKHIVASLIAWNMINISRYGKALKLEEIRWLLGSGEGGEDY